MHRAEAGYDTTSSGPVQGEGRAVGLREQLDLDPGVAQQQLHQEGGIGRPTFRSQRDPSFVSISLPADDLLETA